MSLTGAERTDILLALQEGTDAKLSALKRKTNPGYEVGEKLIVAMGQEQRHIVDRETGEVAVTMALPTVWLEVIEPPFLQNGVWNIRYQVIDERTKPRFLQRGAGGDTLGYTTDINRALDENEAVGEKDLEKFGTQARARMASLRAQEDAYALERSVRDQLKEAVRILGYEDSIPLLAAVQRLIQDSTKQR